MLLNKFKKVYIYYLSIKVKVKYKVYEIGMLIISKKYLSYTLILNIIKIRYYDIIHIFGK